MARVTRTAEELNEASGHVWYELWMLREASVLFAHTEKEKPAANAYLESALVHARGIIEFFRAENAGPRHDDIIALDFFPDDSSPKPWTQLDFGDLKTRIDKQLSHLTFARTQVADRSWNVDDVLARLRPPVDQFLKVVTPSFLCDKWSTQPPNLSVMSPVPIGPSGPSSLGPIGATGPSQ